MRYRAGFFIMLFVLVAVPPLVHLPYALYLPVRALSCAARAAYDLPASLTGLLEFAETDPLPSRIFLCGGGSALPGLKQALLSQEWIQTLPFAKAPQVGFLQPRDIARITDATGELNSPQDITPIGLANLALLDHIEEEKILSGILRHSMESL